MIVYQHMILLMIQKYGDHQLRLVVDFFPRISTNGTVDGQKSSDHQLRLVVEIPLLTRFIYPRWLFEISEPSTC